MNETNSPNTPASPGLAPLGGSPPPTNSGLSPVGGLTPVGGAAPLGNNAPATQTPTLPPPAARPSVASLYDSPTTATPGAASRFSTPASPPAAGSPAPAAMAPRPAPARSADDDAVPTGLIIGSLVSGLLVGALCLLGWRWIWDNIGFNFSFIAIGVGFVIGFVMLSVAQKENPIVQLGAIVLGLGYSVAGVWPSLSSGSLFGILFGVFCVILGTGAAMKASGGGADDSE